MIKKISVHFILITIYLSSMQTACARWATVEDVPHMIDSVKTQVYVNKDASSRTLQEYRLSILKEVSKRYWSQYSINYNPNIEEYKIIEAYTVNDGNRFWVDKQMIEDKPLASSYSGFDQAHQLTISFPNLDVNSQISFKLENVDKKSGIENYFSKLIVIGDQTYVKEYSSHIVSEIPLYLEKHDPENIIDIVQTTQKNKNKILYIIDIKQKKPFIRTTVNEEHEIINPKCITYVSISSEKDWSKLGERLAVHYEKIAKDPLPKLYQEIADIAKTKKTPIEQINTVTALVADKLIYLQNMRTIEGRILPQPLEKVATTRFGDCKDFAMATRVILRELGIPAQFAFVKRGEAVLTLPTTLPNFLHFDHVLLKVKLPTHSLWVDPTNFNSMANYIFADIADRPAFVISDKHSVIEKIPTVEAQNNVTRIEEKWNIKNSDTCQVQGVMKAMGFAAQYYTGLQRRASDESIRHILSTRLSQNYGTILNKEVTLPPLTSRIVEDLSFDYRVLSRNLSVPTNYGLAIPLYFTSFKRF